MKILTIPQPLTTLAAHGFKRLDGRAWATDYRGPIAFYSPRRRRHVPRKEFKRFCLSEPVRTPLYHEIKTRTCFDLAMGQILGVAELVDVERIDDPEALPAYPEISLGGYGPLGCIWHLEHARAFPMPLAVSQGVGRGGLWTPPRDLHVQIVERAEEIGVDLPPVPVFALPPAKGPRPRRRQKFSHRAEGGSPARCLPQPDPMKKPQPDLTGQPQTATSFLVLSDNQVWHGKRYPKNAVFTVTGKLSKDDLHKRDLWLAKGWIRVATEEERTAPPPPPPTVAAPATPPPTLEQTAESADGTFVLLDPRTVAPSPVNPRRHFDEEAMEELVASVLAKGVRLAINVRPMPPGAWEVHKSETARGFFLHDTRRGITVFPPEIMRTIFDTREQAEAALPKWEIIAGERRWRASRLAERPTIRAIVEHLDDVEAAELQVVENAQREDLSDLEEAAGYKHLLGLPGYSMDRLEAHVGKKRNTIYGKLKLLNLPEVALTAMEKGKLPAATAEVIARLPEDLRETATKEIVNHRAWGQDETQALPVREARRVADKLLEEKQKQDTRRQVAGVAANKGWLVLDERKSGEVVNYDSQVNPSCGYVGAFDKCPRDPKGRKWEQVMKDRPALKTYAAIRWDSSSKQFITTPLYERDDVNPWLKKLGLWNAEGSKATKEKDKKQREKEVHGRKVEAMHVAIDGLKERAEGDGPQFAMTLLRPLLRALIQANAPAAFFVAKRRAIVSADQDTYTGRDKARRALLKLVGTEAAKYDCGLAAELAIAALSGDYGEAGYYKEGIQQMADALGVLDPTLSQRDEQEEGADVRTTEPAEVAAA